MTTGVVSAHEGAAVKEIVLALTSHRVSTIPVLDDDRKVVGVVTSADLLARISRDRGTVPRGHRLAASGEKARKTTGRTAKDVMTSPAVTARPSDPILHTARQMARARVRCLPVVDDEGVLLGIVTKGDLLKRYLVPDDEVRRWIEQDIVQERLVLNPFTVDVDVTEGIVTLSGSLDKPAIAVQLVTAVRELPGVLDVDETRLRVRLPGERA